MAYFSKQLDSIASGWPGCLWVVSVMALLVEEATKPSLEQPLEVLISHQVQGILEIKGHQWLTGRCFTKYQVFLLDFPDITLKDTKP